jgi:hypothetical protein
MKVAPLLFFLSSAATTACGGTTIALHPPELAASEARERGAKVDLDPIATRPAAAVLRLPSGESIATKPDAAEILTSAIRAELRARALRGGEPEGYSVQCTLDRFAVRDETKLAGAGRLAALYVDASCDVQRTADRALAWRGELRGRAAAVGMTSPLAPTLPLVQSMVDRMVSDAAREMAADLVVRVLDLEAGPSARVFADDAARASAAGIDDGPLGAAALSEEATPEVKAAQKDDSAATRAAAWNAVAMSGALDTAGFVPDGDDQVRFYQYKALARAGTSAALDQLRAAASRDEDTLLVELARDALASGGLGPPRRTNASTVTNGTTTRP